MKLKIIKRRKGRDDFETSIGFQIVGKLHRKPIKDCSRFYRQQ